MENHHFFSGISQENLERSDTLWLWLTVRHGKSPFLIGKPSINGPFSMAMLNNQMVTGNYEKNHAWWHWRVHKNQTKTVGACLVTSPFFLLVFDSPHNWFYHVTYGKPRDFLLLQYFQTNPMFSCQSSPVRGSSSLPPRLREQARGHMDNMTFPLKGSSTGRWLVICRWFDDPATESKSGSLGIPGS